MIELVLVYCLIGNEHSCTEKRDPLEQFASPVSCMADAQQRAQEYLKVHPKWHLVRWRCEVNKPHEATL